MTIAFPDGSKIVFPWHQMYNWSREAGSGTPVLASALMALEAWAHRRIEAGEPVDKVVADVIGAANRATRRFRSLGARSYSPMIFKGPGPTISSSPTISASRRFRKNRSAWQA